MKIAAIDIDGVLNDYPNTFIRFMKSKGYSYEKLCDIKSNLSYSNYKKLKSEYRNSDFKHKAKLSKGVLQLFKYLHNNNYLIYLITSRKLFENDMLEKTIQWLKSNGVEYDYIYCTIKKDFTIFEKFKNVKILIEDNRDNINKVLNINKDIKCFNITNKDNINEELNSNAIKIDSLLDVIKYLEKIK